MIHASANEIAEDTLLERRYRLLEQIGAGGAGRVFRAEDVHLQRTIAVKVMHNHGDEGLGAVERARSEMLLLASLNHPCLVTLFDARIGRAPGEVNYLVMEYVPGLTLRQHLDQGRVDAAELAGIALDIAEGLHVAHTSGVVHRDVKPSNVLLWRSPLANGRWRAKVADFGIAYLEHSTRATDPGLVIGTAAYLAPEQARGETPTPAADIYALGILLIEALTGQRPFGDVSGIGALTARLLDAPVIPASLPRAWRELLQAMTAMRPEDRPTALEVSIAAARLTVPDAVGGDGAAGAGLRAAAAAVPTAPLAAAAVATARLPQVPATRRERAAAAAAPTAPLRLPAVPAPLTATSAVSARRTGSTEAVTVPAARAHSRHPRRVYAAAAGVALLAVLSVSTISAVIGSTGSTDPAPVVQEEPAPAPVEPAPVEPAPVEQPANEPAVVTPVDTPTEQTVVAEDPGPKNPNAGPGNNNGNTNPNRGPGNNNGNGNGNR
ncbi:serine/threonine protein kinase [Microbacterium sp. Sa4CUA7]|uniref:non-specific serine/threonine protein kinase n=1 Tax=Microbacterium pullorum TaxID=2762236 RepID=A0ABR8RYK5_9MICO|nr:serine/threonine-protein kinase [Microbacterium pullorum]MBD7956322.1 serine/threonine protein kinase [Microbacterium pullorum]